MAPESKELDSQIERQKEVWTNRRASIEEALRFPAAQLAISLASEPEAVLLKQRIEDTPSLPDEPGVEYPYSYLSEGEASRLEEASDIIQGLFHAVEKELAHRNRTRREIYPNG